MLLRFGGDPEQASRTDIALVPLLNTVWSINDPFSPFFWLSTSEFLALVCADGSSCLAWCHGDALQCVFHTMEKASGETKLWTVQFVTVQRWQQKLWMKTCGTLNEPVNRDGFPYFSFLVGIECRLNFILTAKCWADCRAASVCPHFWALGNPSCEWIKCKQSGKAFLLFLEQIQAFYMR